MVFNECYYLQVEDIVDTGHTLTKLMDFILKEGAQSVECAVLLDKEARRTVPVNAKYTGFKVSVLKAYLTKSPKIKSFHRQ